MFLLSSLSAFAAPMGPSMEAPREIQEEEEVQDTGVYGCSDQYLQDGRSLPDLPLFYVRAQPGASWGTAEMVDLIVETGRHMSWVMPGASPFVVGDISNPGGGAIYGHKSHRGGVDVDIGLYKKGGWQNPRGFDRLSPSELDLEATWMLISTMLDSGMVDFILLDQGHIRALRAYTQKKGLLTAEEAERIFPVEGTPGLWERSGIVRHAPGHQDHVHVRVLCGDGTRPQ